MGHAFGSLCFAAAALGWRDAPVSALSDAEVAGVLGVDRTSDFNDVEAEHPDLITAVVTVPACVVQFNLTKGLVANVRSSLWEGKANQLNPDHVDWVEITAVENASVKPHTATLPLRNLAASKKPEQRLIRNVPRSAAIIRQRRSAVNMDSRTGLSLDAFFGMLMLTLPDRPQPPRMALVFPTRIHLYLLVH